VPYAFIVAGSLARREQTVHTDQDNAIILSDDYDERAHGDYFAELARRVNDALDACGYVYCPGEVMARNEKWRRPLAAWRQRFQRWILSPEPKALMHASIFFDLRCLHGDAALLDALWADVREMARGNTIFLAHMAANALHYRPPLGFFRQFVLERSGREEPALDMKKRGVVPIIDLARVHALAAGVAAVSTRERLEEAAAAGELSEEGMRELLDAFDFISLVRLRHQAERIRAGEKPDNFVAPEELSALERRHLKDAFDVVRTMQAALEQRYQAGRLP
jgi:CBS domain-containing protein